ncbi:adenosylcobinamide amidohydrolase [Halostella sp. JP-L12]|uniref:adenosylcobinamide amidohydrolase n=1 Tax=Halostella TaxID=1843185 RepID=UPI000EF84B0D|nr:MULTISPECIES: adenosylcobinamide amidohydrolase [Halostella]NHN47956.1 adenosylcobinamide amidohydrolase [Halostella sp. JP-L12]
MFETAVRDGVARLARPGARWLSTGFDGGERRADAAYNVTVPEGWDRTDLADYVAERRADAGFETDGPALLTGVSQRHARVARHGPAAAVATAGLSNPSPLFASAEADRGAEDPSGAPPAGTVNVFVGVERSLGPGALANLVAVAAEAKAATLSRETGFPGTTTDAVVAACDPDGDHARFSGSGTAVGSAAQACVREAVRASLDSRYAAEDETTPDSVADARHGVTPVAAADVEVFAP